MKKQRIEWSSVMEYNQAFPDDHCSVAEPGTLLVIISHSGKMVACNFFDETDEQFLERLERSITDNHNYFLDEWKEFIPEEYYKPGFIY